MKLLGDFFEVLEKTVTGSGLIFTIKLNPGHIVYQGHFPGHPVTPGVIQMQIVHELLEEQLGKKLKLRSMGQCKFLNVLNPEEVAQIDIHISLIETDGFIHVKARGKNEDQAYFNLISKYQS